MQGTVKFYNESKGFGFIETQDGDIFVHATGIKKGETLNTGDKVQFEIVDGKKGPNAKNVKVI